MKKLIASAILLCALVSTAFANTNDIRKLEQEANQLIQEANKLLQTEPPSPTADQLVEKFGDKLDHYITALASKAGVAADHFWPIFVKQQMIEGIYAGCLWCMGLLIAISALTIAMLNNPYSSDEQAKQHPNALPKTIIGFIVFATLTSICAIAAIDVGQEIISKTFNPEYHAVQSLVNMVK